jgi:hypothetical protein
MLGHVEPEHLELVILATSIGWRSPVLLFFPLKVIGFGDTSCESRLEYAQIPIGGFKRSR